MEQRFIDTSEFTRLGRQLQGTLALQSLQRLTADLPPQGDGVARWSVRGWQDAGGRARLEVCVAAAPVVQCQRCMQPMAWPVDACSVLQVMDAPDAGAGPESADAQMPADDWVEPVEASTRLDLHDLVEDEIILALPGVPMHAQCHHPALGPDASADGQGDEASPVSPFEALRQLKKN